MEKVMWKATKEQVKESECACCSGSLTEKTIKFVSVTHDELLICLSCLKEAAVLLEGIKNIDIAFLKIGDKVCYQPHHYKRHDKYENGVVSRIQVGGINSKVDGVWVVYNCDDDWDNFKNYTGTLTNLEDLKLGWRD